MPEDGLLGTIALHLRYDIGYRAAFCAGWAVLCAGCLIGTLGFITFLYKPQWRTQTDLRTGMKYTGLRSYLIGWGAFWFSGPILTFIGYPIAAVSDWLTGHAWMFPITAAALGVAVAAVFGIRWWWRNRKIEETPVVMPPQAPQPYSQPYGQWSRDEQVIR